MNNNSNLEFRKIKSLNFLYEISEDGRIFRNVKSKKQRKIILDMHHSKTGYYAVWVCIKGRTKRCMIHSLIAECWLGDKPDGYEIDHIDRNNHNNHYTNLRYVTHSEQMKNRVLSDKIIKQATANCAAYVETIKKPVRIKHTNGEEYEFSSMTDCSRFLAELYEKKPEQMRYKLKKRRKCIYDFTVFYGMQRLDTATLRSKEQSI
jgi:hypothetical protein